MMNRTTRLWCLLLIVFSAVIAVFVNHDLLIINGDRMIVKDRATVGEIIVRSTLAGVLLSSLTTGVHVLIERLLKKKES